MTLLEIRALHGPAGLSDLAPAGGRWGAVTDAAKASLFTAEGLVRWALARSGGEDRGPLTAVLDSSRRWRATRGLEAGGPDGGWLGRLTRLRVSRGTRGALPGEPRDGAEGPGPAGHDREVPAETLVRAAPLGAVCEPGEAFRAGCEVAASTESDPCARISAGALAAIVARVRGGETLEEAALATRDDVVSSPGYGRTARAFEAALGAARSAQPTAETVELLGSGEAAEEALSIGLFCALSTGTFEEGVLLAVNHGGASAVTGSVAGILLGVSHGPWSIPARWLETVELVPEIEEIAADLDAALRDGPNPELLARYPAGG